MGRPGHGFQQHTAHSLGVSALPSRPTGTLPIPWGSRRFPAGPRHLVQEVCAYSLEGMREQKENLMSHGSAFKELAV